MFVALSKSQTPDGSYVPVTRLSPMQREFIRYKASGEAPRRTPLPASRHSVADAYPNHAIAPHLEKFRAAPTRPSRAHPNVHYDAAMSHSNSDAVDRALDPALTRKLKHPVVFHAQKLPDSVAAAARPSAVTRGRGHVVLNNGHGYTSQEFRDVVNHEVVHTMARGNPASFGNRGQLSAIREEARADAQGIRQGRGGYRQNGMFGSPHAHQVRARLAAQSKPEHTSLRERVARDEAYHGTHAKIRAAQGRPSDLGSVLARRVQRIPGASALQRAARLRRG